MEKTYTKEQIIQAILNEYKNEFGKLNDDNERNGYFISGFVGSALDNLAVDNETCSVYLPDTNDTSGKCANCGKDILMHNTNQGAPWIKMPKHIDYHNGTHERCDMLIGACCCGAMAR